MNIDRTSAAIPAAALLALLAAAPTLISAQPSAAVVPPVPLEQPMPEVPVTRNGTATEGWVKIRYSVTPEGATTDVRAVDSMPADRHVRTAVAAVERWRFEAATENGTAIPWHNNVAWIVLDSDDVPQRASAAFSAAYAEAAEHIAEGDYIRGKEANAAMQREDMSRLYEIGLANLQLAAVELGLGDAHAAYEAILRATEPEVEQLVPSELADALRYRFAIELALGRAADALETYQRLVAIEPLPDDDPAVQQVQSIAEAMEREDSAIVIQARVDGEAWVHEPARRTFAVAEVDGELEEIEVECHRRTATLPFQADVEWSVPASWGDCVLSFVGREGTTFALYELQ